MALTINGHPELNKWSIGNRYMAEASFALDSSYPAGGYLVDPVLIGFTKIERLIGPSFQFRLSPYLLEYIYNPLTNFYAIRVCDGATGVEVAVGSNLNALSDIPVVFIGV